MALIKCHECGTEVSTEAKTCPKCGAKPKKPPGLASMLIVILIGLIFVVAMTTDGPDGSTPQPETPEQKAQKEAQAARYAVAAAMSKRIRETMRDPDSLKFESLWVNKDASVVCAEYRARNGFGGMNREIMVISKEGTSQKVSTWNKRCTKSVYDMMWAAK